MSITRAGTSNYGLNLATLAVTTTVVGDLAIFGVKISSATTTVSGVSGGNVTTWARVGAGFTDSTHGIRTEIWTGPITSTGSSSISVTYSPATPGVTCDLWFDEWHDSISGVTWSAVASNGSSNGYGANATWATLSSSALSGDQGYVGFGWISSAFVDAMATTGFSFANNANGNPEIWNLDLSASTSYSPIGTLNTSDVSSTIGAIILAQTSSPPPSPEALTTWQTAIANASTTPAKVVVLGDDMSEGQGATVKSDRYMDVLLAELRTAYGFTGGEGYIPSWYATYTPPALWTSSDIPVLSGTKIYKEYFGLGARGVILTTPDIAVTPGIAAGTGTAYQPSISGGTSKNASAGVASGTGTAYEPTTGSSGGNPSGWALPASDAYAGYTGVMMDDFLGTELNVTTNWDTSDGTAQGGFVTSDDQYGPFFSSNGSVSGSIAYLANQVVSGTRGGTGMYSQWTGNAGKIVIAARFDGGAGVSMVFQITGADNWPPETDFYEDGSEDNTRTNTTVTQHSGEYGTGAYENGPQFSFSDNTAGPGGSVITMDGTAWNQWGVEFNETTTKYTVQRPGDAEPIVWCTQSTNTTSGTYGYSSPMFLAIQNELNDGVSTNDDTPSVVNLEMDWVWIGEPS